MTYSFINTLFGGKIDDDRVNLKNQKQQHQHGLLQN